MVLVTSRRPLLHTHAATFPGLDVGGANIPKMKELKVKTLMHRGEFVSIVNFGISRKANPNVAYRTVPELLPATTFVTRTQTISLLAKAAIQCLLTSHTPAVPQRNKAAKVIAMNTKWSVYGQAGLCRLLTNSIEKHDRQNKDQTCR